MPHVLAITGATGYLGRRVIEAAARDPAWDRVLGLDIAPAREAQPEYESVLCDVTRPFAALFRARGVTAAVHLAFQVDPRHDLQGMRRLNVGGCENFLRACAAAGVRSALVVSSATAYGARPDNPARIAEDQPLRAIPRFPYAWHKAQAERLCARFIAEEPATRLSVARPCVVVGPRMDNYLSRMMLRPVVFGAWGNDPPLQFVHEKDVARAIAVLVREEASGAYNLAPDDTVRFSEIAAHLARPLVRLPGHVLLALTEIAWRLRLRWLTETPAGFLDYIRYPWCVCNERLTRELGFRFQYSTQEALLDWLRAMDSADGDDLEHRPDTEKTAA